MTVDPRGFKDTWICAERVGEPQGPPGCLSQQVGGGADTGGPVMEESLGAVSSLGYVACETPRRSGCTWHWEKMCGERQSPGTEAQVWGWGVLPSVILLHTPSAVLDKSHQIPGPAELQPASSPPLQNSFSSPWLVSSLLPRASPSFCGRAIHSFPLSAVCSAASQRSV